MLDQTHLPSKPAPTSCLSAWEMSLSNPPASIFSCLFCWIRSSKPCGRHFLSLTGVLTPPVGPGPLAEAPCYLLSWELCEASPHSMVDCAREQPAAEEHIYGQTQSHDHPKGSEGVFTLGNHPIEEQRTMRVWGEGQPLLHTCKF